MPGKFSVTLRDNGQHGFALVAANGERILVSEGYDSRDNCLIGIEAVRKNALDAQRFTKLGANNGQLYFVLRAANGEIIGSSETYASESGRDGGIASVAENAADASIVEH